MTDFYCSAKVDKTLPYMVIVKQGYLERELSRSD